MKKIEFIWRHILFETIEKRNVRFQQQELAGIFGISSSTVNLALASLERMGAVKIGGRGFEVTDTEKILFHWANHRRLSNDVFRQLSIRLSVVDIEGFLPDGTVPTAYTAVREWFSEPPADYDKIYCYHHHPEVIADRFRNEEGKGPANLYILQSDPFLQRYGKKITLGHLFVDLWNLSDWYAKDFAKRIKEHIDGLLS